MAREWWGGEPEGGENFETYSRGGGGGGEGRLFF